MSWFLSNWDLCLAVFFVLEKLVKISTTKYDDILFDMTKDVVMKIAGKKGVESDK